MPEGWQWDPTLFRGSAAYYERGRLPYAPGFAEVLGASLGLDGQGRLLDVGCGPGTVTLPMARYFGEAVGVDPDQDMLAEAERRARHLGVANVRWARARAEDLPAGLGTFRVVLFAQSFHWTDRDRVAATVFRMLVPGGAFVHISDHQAPPANPLPLPHPPPPLAQIGELASRYLGPERRAGQGVLRHGTPDREDIVLAQAGFEVSQQITVPACGVAERTTDDIAAWVFSRSSTAPHLFGSRLGDFDRDLRAVLRQASADGMFAEQLPDTEILIGTKPAQPADQGSS